MQKKGNLLFIIKADNFANLPDYGLSPTATKTPSERFSCSELIILKNDEDAVPKYIRELRSFSRKIPYKLHGRLSCHSLTEHIQ